MNPLIAIADIAKAISYPLRMLFVVGLLLYWARALRAPCLAALTAGFAWLVYRWPQRRKTMRANSNPAR